VQHKPGESFIQFLRRDLRFGRDPRLIDRVPGIPLAGCEFQTRRNTSRTPGLIKLVARFSPWPPPGIERCGKINAMNSGSEG